MKNTLSIKGFKPYLLVLFLNAFVDLGHKITIQNTLFKVYEGQTQVVLIAIINAFMLIPFILLLIPAGTFSNRYPKVRVMRASAWASVGLTGLITLFYYLGWYPLAFFMTLLMATQSAIYSPSKYGYIRELVGLKRLGEANGYVQAATMISILLGIFVFSILFETLLSGHDFQNEADIVRTIAPLGLILMLCAALELWSAYRLPEFEASDPSAKMQWRTHNGINPISNAAGEVFSHRIIWWSVLGLSVFWGVSQMALATFPAFAKAELGETNTVVIQGILAVAGVGIFAGSLLAGRLSRDRIEQGLIPIGALGFGLALLLVPAMKTHVHFMLAFFCVGFAGALFIVPLNSLVQYHAKQATVGNTLAGVNWVQNISMLAFLAITIGFSLAGVVPGWLFYLMGAAGIAVAVVSAKVLIKRMVYFIVSSVLSLRYVLKVKGHQIPETGGVLLLGNHISWLDWAMIQWAARRHIFFVIDRFYAKLPITAPLVNLWGAVPISERGSRQALDDIRQLLEAGEVVCLFPEGGITHSGELGRFKPGYERAVKDSGAVIMPFYIHGLWGSWLSRAPAEARATTRTGWRRRSVRVRFGAPLADSTKAVDLQEQVLALKHDAIQ